MDFVPVLALAGIAACATSAHAQQASALDAPGFVLPRVEGPGLASMKVAVRSFRFEGHTVFSTATLQALLADAVGQRLDPSALDELRKRITRLYTDAGYLNSGALLAQGESADRAHGIVTFRIVEGRLGAVQLRGLDGLWQGYVQGRLQREDELLNIHRLQERFRLLLADPLFDKINSRIVPGDVPGSALLDIDIHRAPPYALEVFANNHRAPSVGSRATGVQAVVRNLTGLGDALQATLQHTAGGDPWGVAWSATPWTPAVRTFVSVEHSVSAVVEESLVAIDIKSRNRGSEAGVSYALTDTLARRVDLTLAYGRRHAATTLLGQPFSFSAGEPDGISEIRTWRFSQDWTERWDQQTLAVRTVWSSGTNNVDTVAAQASVVDPAVVPAHRYWVWNGQVQHLSTGLPLGAELRLRGNFQLTGQRLLPLAQMALGGNGSVRGYRENTVLRDRGLAASAEYRLPLWPTAQATGRASVFTFVDAGGASNVGQAWQHLASAGVGASWQHDGLSAEVSWAKPLKRLSPATHGDLQDRGVQFQLRQKIL